MLLSVLVRRRQHDRPCHLFGDIVTVQQSRTARHGDIVAALLDDEATVKRLYRQNPKYCSFPHNPGLPADLRG